MTISSFIFSYVVYNLVGAFLGLATMLRGESLSARVDSQCAEKNVKMCRTCVGCVGITIVNTDFCSSFLSLSLFFFFFYANVFSSTLGILRKLKFCSPSYFGITRRNNINIFFATKKNVGHFSAFYGQRLVTEPGAWSILKYVIFLDNKLQRFAIEKLEMSRFTVF